VNYYLRAVLVFKVTIALVQAVPRSMQQFIIVLLFWRYRDLTQRRWILTIHRLSPIHSSTLLAPRAVRPVCGRCWRVPAIAHPLKASCSQCFPLLAASNIRIALALLSPFHYKQALAPLSAARQMTTGRQPRSRSLRTLFLSLKRAWDGGGVKVACGGRRGPLLSNFHETESAGGPAD